MLGFGVWVVGGNYRVVGGCWLVSGKWRVVCNKYWVVGFGL